MRKCNDEVYQLAKDQALVKKLKNKRLLLRRLYNILYFLWLYSEFFIILYNILNIAELDCCQIIILGIYVPSTHAYTHVLRLSLDLPYEKR
jgi:hypothetical protein